MMKRITNKLNIATILFLFILLGISKTTNAASPGSLDPSFGVAGRVVTDVFGTDLINDIAVQEDGKIVAVGSSSSINDFVIVRYNINGQLDSTFSSDGIVFVDINGNDRASGLAIQEDGKIIVIGNSDNSSLSVIRLNINGSLDTGFATGGKFNTVNMGRQGFIQSGTGSLILKPGGVDLQQDRKIVISGTTQGSLPVGFGIMRLNSNGVLDTTFDTDGFVTAPFDTAAIFNKSANDVKIQNDGKIVAVGKAASDSSAKSVIIRYNSNGSLDTTFSGDGIAVFNFTSGNTSEILNRLVIDSNTNKITAVGYSGTTAIGLTAIRLLSNGTPDTSFSNDGLFNLASALREATDTIIQSDGKLLIVGVRSRELFVLRLNVNGTTDSLFGDNGLLSIPEVGQNYKSLHLVGDKLIVGNGNNDTDFGLMRFNLSTTPSQSGDFDGDGFGDIAVYRPSQGLWIILNSSDNSVVFKQFGLNGDIPIDGDFDGDGRNDFAIYRPSEGLWFVEKSGDGSNFARQFGTSSDKPITNDYDKDGKADIAFFRPLSGEWFILRSSDNFNTFFAFPFGANGDIPIVKKGP